MPNMSVVDGRWLGQFPYPAITSPDTLQDNYLYLGYYDINTTNTFNDKDSRIQFYIRNGSVSSSVSTIGMDTYFNTSDGSGTPSVTLTPSATTTQGYINYTNGTVSGTPLYYNIKTLSGISVNGGTVGGSSSAIGTNVTLSSTDNGIKIQTKYTASYTDVKLSGNHVGWLSKTSGTIVKQGAQKPETDGTAYYITAITVPKDTPFSVTTTADTALDTTSTLSITNNNYRQIDITNKGTVLSDQTTSGKGDVLVKAYGDSSSTAVITDGAWVEPTVSAAGTYYGKVTIPAATFSDITGTINVLSVTPNTNITFTQINYGFTETQPAGTDGTDYLTLDPSASSDNDLSISLSDSVTSAGYVPAGPLNMFISISGGISIKGGTNKYIPIVTTSFSGGGLTKSDFAKNDLALTLATGSETNMSNVTIGAKSTTTYPYYFKVSGSTPAVSGTTTVTRAAVTYSNSAGVIAAHNAESALASTSLDADVSVNATSNSTYISLKEAGFTVSANKVYCNAAGYIGADLTNAIGTIPTGTIVNNTSLPSGSSSSGTLERGGYIKIGAGYYANDLYYVAEANGSGTKTITGAGTTSVDGYAYASVAAATITYTTTTVSGSTATRGTATWTSGWIDANSTATTADLSRLGVATFANTATSNVTYVDISNTTAAPVLVSGGYLYINEGYTDNLKISLAKLAPDVPTGKTVAPASYILSGYAAFDSDGALITGTMATYNGAYTLTYAN